MATRRQIQSASVAGGIIYALGYLWSTAANINWLDIIYSPVVWVNNWIMSNVDWIAQNVPSVVTIPILAFIIGFLVMTLLMNIQK